MQNPPVTDERRKRVRKGPSKLEDLMYDAFYSAAVGGCALAVFFMIADIVSGEALWTPSLMGSVLFLGLTPEAVTEVRLDMVAYFTAVHIGGFAVLGILTSVFAYEVELHAAHPVRVIALFFLIIQGGFLISASLAMPGVITAIGVGRILTGNILTAVAMALFMLNSHNSLSWDHLLGVIPGRWTPDFLSQKGVGGAGEPAVPSEPGE